MTIHSKSRSTRLLLYFMLVRSGVCADEGSTKQVFWQDAPRVALRLVVFAKTVHGRDDVYIGRFGGP